MRSVSLAALGAWLAAERSDVEKALRRAMRDRREGGVGPGRCGGGGEDSGWPEKSGADTFVRTMALRRKICSGCLLFQARCARNADLCGRSASALPINMNELLYFAQRRLKWLCAMVGERAWQACLPIGKSGSLFGDLTWVMSQGVASCFPRRSPYLGRQTTG